MMVVAGLTATQHSLRAQTYGGEEGAKASEFRIRSVKPKFDATPDIQSSYPKPGAVGGTPTKWLRVEVEFDSSLEYADNVEFRWYIAVTGEKKPVVFADSVTHINVKRGSRHLSVIFMPPRTVDRYAKNSQVKQIAVQLWHDQKLADTGGWPNEPKTRWWEEVKPERGALLNLLQTPFGVLEYDRYEQIRVSPPTP
jgi:hypothetical protein